MEAGRLFDRLAKVVGVQEILYLLPNRLFDHEVLAQPEQGADTVDLLLELPRKLRGEDLVLNHN